MRLFRISKIQFFESNSQQTSQVLAYLVVVQNIKDTIFWKQFTTICTAICAERLLFRISKIQFFESNSQRACFSVLFLHSCSEYQRYNFLKAIHNRIQTIGRLPMLFRISKIQFFESNSQRRASTIYHCTCCSEYQRYNFLKAIHNWSCFD